MTTQGQEEEGIAQMRQGVTAVQAIGLPGMVRPYYRAVLAEAHLKIGQAEAGLGALVEVFAEVPPDGKFWFEPELYRIKGELTLKSKVKTSPRQVKASQNKSEDRSPESEAEECFWKAIDIARQQQAKSLELRAVMGLSRLWQQQGKTEEARKLLSEIYGWFTEGFDTADLKEAKALLEELEEQPHVTRREKRKGGKKRPARKIKPSVRTLE